MLIWRDYEYRFQSKKLGIEVKRDTLIIFTTAYEATHWKIKIDSPFLRTMYYISNIPGKYNISSTHYAYEIISVHELNNVSKNNSYCKALSTDNIKKFRLSIKLQPKRKYRNISWKDLNLARNIFFYRKKKVYLHYQTLKIFQQEPR